MSNWNNKDIWNTRPVVNCFAQQMEKMLRANDYKGGWEDSTQLFLLSKLCEEVAEVANAFQNPGTSDLTHECADVANIAMMIADNWA